MSLAWSPDGKRLAITEMYGRSLAFLLNPETGERTQSVSPPEGGGSPVSCSWFPNGSLLAIGFGNRTVRLWEMQAANLLRDLKVPKDVDVGMGVLSWGANAETLACWGDGSAAASLLDTSTGEVIKKLSVSARSLSLSPDGTRLVGGGPTSCKVWDAETGEELRDVPEAGHPVAWLGNERLVTGRGKLNPPRHALRILGGQGFRVKKEFPGIPRGVFSADGRRLASTWGNAVLLWETETGTPRGTLEALRNGMNLMLSPDGHFRATKGVDRERVYLTVTDAGQQVLPPAEFATKYGWQNDPSNVKLLAP